MSTHRKGSVTTLQADDPTTFVPDINNEGTSTPTSYKGRGRDWRVLREGIGYLSFSIVFNVLNTIVYSALYPKILEHITTDKKSYSTAFSIINTVTTLASAVALPLYGSLVDCLQWIKPSL